MGREVRRVIPNWEHPKTENLRGKQHYQPLYNEDYETAITEWIKNHQLWMKGEHPDQLDSSSSKYKYFAQWGGNAPDVEDYRPKWSAEEATWYQLYETVSEGTPVSPPFATPEELVDYLASNGDFWDQIRGDGPYSREAAERMVKDEWAPSFVVDTGAGQMAAGAEGLLILDKRE